MTLLQNYGLDVSGDAAADFHVILAAFAAEGIEKMAAFGNGYPPELTFEDWQSICAEMAGGFREYAECVSTGTETAETIERLNKSLDLLRAWFPHLWD